MRAVIAMQDMSPPLERRAGRREGPGIVERAREVWSVCARAAEAAHAYESMKSLSDAELRKRGLERSELPRAAFHKLTEGI